MKATGIIRKVDELGRIVLPKELRDTMQIGEKDPLEIFVDGNMILLRKYAPGCTFCGNEVDVQIHWNKPICGKCVQEISNSKKAAAPV